MRGYAGPLLGALLSAVSYTSAAAAAPCFVSTHVRTTSPVGAPGKGTCSRICPELRTGVALAAKAKSGGKKKAVQSAGGFGAKSETTTKTVDAAALLTKSMKLYDELSRADATMEVSVDDDVENEPGLREYVVCVRSKGYDAVSDWVPAACMGVMWVGAEVDGNPLLKGMADHNLFAPIATKLHCREVWESACQAAPSLRKLPRNSIQYAYEPLDNFGSVIEEVDGKGGSTAQAYKTLSLEKGSTAAEIKSAHRKLIVKLHPDRVSSLPQAEQAQARLEFEAVQEAYEVLGGGSGDNNESWYENLGSGGRTDFFSGPIDLTKPVDPGMLDFWSSAVCPIDTELTNKFVMRNVMRKTLASEASV